MVSALCPIVATQTHAEDRDARAGLAYDIEADAGLARRARARRQHERIRLALDQIRDARFVVSHDIHGGAERTEIVHQIPRETVVIIDENDLGARHEVISTSLGEEVKAAKRAPAVRQRHEGHRDRLTRARLLGPSAP